MMYSVVVVKHDSVELMFTYYSADLSTLFLHAWLNNAMNGPDFVCDAGTFRTGIKECTKVQKILESHKEKRCAGR